MKHSRSSQCLAMFICFIFAIETGCTHWKEIPKPQDDPTTNWEDRQVKLRRGSVERVIDVKNLTYPKLEGSELDRNGQRQLVVLDLRDFDEVELLEVDGTRTALLVGGVVVGFLVFLLVKINMAIHSD
jgi:hypothetical protein